MPLRFGLFAADGTPRAFFSDDIHNDIPSDAIHVTDAEWQSLLAGTSRWNGSRVVDFAPPVAPPVKAVGMTYKADIWRRCTDDEAEALVALLANQPIRQQRIFNDATSLSHDDPLFSVLKDAVMIAFGASRAAELLAPSA